MGKRAKAHRKKVAKRNANLKQQERVIQKLWQESFKEQMDKIKENFTSMSGDTMSGITKMLDEFEPKFDSAGFSIEDREEPKEENKQ